LTAGVDPATVDRALGAMLREVEDLRARPPAPEEVARARRRVAGLHLLDHEDLRRRAFYPAWYELVGAGYRFDRQVTELVSRVTPADVQRVARRYLEHPAVAVVGPVLP
jgi:zinc protease